MIREQKVTPEQRRLLIELWKAGKVKELRKLQKALGVEKKYAQKRAYDDGFRRLPNTAQDYNDPRWKWAIERGPVIA